MEYRTGEKLHVRSLGMTIMGCVKLAEHYLNMKSENEYLPTFLFVKFADMFPQTAWIRVFSLTV